MPRRWTIVCSTFEGSLRLVILIGHLDNNLLFYSKVIVTFLELEVSFLSLNDPLFLRFTLYRVQTFWLMDSMLDCAKAIPTMPPCNTALTLVNCHVEGRDTWLDLLVSRIVLQEFLRCLRGTALLEAELPWPLYLSDFFEGTHFFQLFDGSLVFCKSLCCGLMDLDKRGLFLFGLTNFLLHSDLFTLSLARVYNAHVVCLSVGL